MSSLIDVFFYLEREKGECRFHRPSGHREGVTLLLLDRFVIRAYRKGKEKKKNSSLDFFFFLLFLAIAIAMFLLPPFLARTERMFPNQSFLAFNSSSSYIALCCFRSKRERESADTNQCQRELFFSYFFQNVSLRSESL